MLSGIEDCEAGLDGVEASLLVKMNLALGTASEIAMKYTRPATNRVMHGQGCFDYTVKIASLSSLLRSA
jgi:hypothetical protein